MVALHLPFAFMESRKAYVKKIIVMMVMVVVVVVVEVVMVMVRTILKRS